MSIRSRIPDDIPARNQFPTLGERQEEPTIYVNNTPEHQKAYPQIPPNRMYWMTLFHLSILMVNLYGFTQIQLQQAAPEILLPHNCICC